MKTQELTVLYDGGCPLCSREINHYRRLASFRPVRWVDVTQDDAGIEGFGLDQAEALRLFHVIDASGELQTGLRAFMALWSELPGYRWLSVAIRQSRAETWLERLYRRFAAWHFRRRCPDGVCGLPGKSA
jgi:predicted DCC family thiol-disulfide oxidoreductase YuxK